MRLKFFTVPVLDPGEAEKEVNAFLAANRILQVDRGLVGDASAPCWSICVGYQERAGGQASISTPKSKVDYREILEPAEFEIFAEMRRWRKETAASDGVPPYQVFTNEQLAGLVQQRIRSAEALGRLPGVGPARKAKYGQLVLDRFEEQIADLDQPAESKGAPDDPSAR